MRDAVGQTIEVGNVCSHVFRVSSSIYHDLLLVTGFTDGRVVGYKQAGEGQHRKSRPIYPCNLVVTKLTEEDF